MKKEITAKYFPLYRAYPSRLKQWEKRLSYRQTHPAAKGKYLVRLNCSVFAPAPAAVGKEILFISDLHYQGNEQILEDIENLLGKSRPDYLVLGGDQVGDADHIESLRAILPRLRKLAPVVLAVGGNWEEGKRWIEPGFWKQFYAEAGIIYLANESWQDDFFRFTGVRDVSCGLPKIAEPVRHGCRGEILLSHSPDTVIALDSGKQLQNFDYVLCGHTHGGQIRLPFWGALHTPSRYGTCFDCGLFRRRSNHLRMIVSTGVSELSFPWRFNCRREFVVIKFRKSSRYHVASAHVEK